MQSQTMLLGTAMARKKPGRPTTTNRDDVPVKLDRKVAAKLRFLAEDRGVPIAQLLTDAVRPWVEREFEKATKGEKS